VALGGGRLGGNVSPRWRHDAQATVAGRHAQSEMVKGRPTVASISRPTIGRLGKRGGSYVGLTDQLQAEFVPVKNFRFEIGLPFAYYDIAGVPGLDDVHRGAFGGLTFSARYKLLDSEHSPFALALGIEPHWSRVDENSGDRVENFGGELSIAADTAIVKDRVFSAVNIIYDPEVTRLQSTGVLAERGDARLSGGDHNPGAAGGVPRGRSALSAQIRWARGRSPAMLFLSARPCSCDFQRPWRFLDPGTFRQRVTPPEGPARSTW
jgi:hypothetical protein